LAYRGGTDWVDLFNHYGFRDVYELGFLSRAVFAKEKLTELSGKPAMADLLCSIADPRNWFNIMAPQDAESSHDECVAKQYRGFTPHRVAQRIHISLLHISR
jgi:hypothetical protein